MASPQVTIYHNPRCSKSRETLALLQERGIEPRVVEYLKAPPTAAELKALLQRLGLPAHALLRVKEAPYAALGLSPASSEDEIIAAIAEHPVLLERPIVAHGTKAAIGRPPKAVLAIL